MIYTKRVLNYWGGYYKDALVKFEAVQKIYPKHSEINQFISDSQQKNGSSKILWSNYKTIFFVYDGVAGTGVIVLILITFFGKGKKKQPLEEQPQNPEGPENVKNTITDDNKQ